MLDGIDNNARITNSFSVLPSVEAIEEFKVQSSNSSAEFGRSGGAQINVVLKSGTNDWHGSLFEFVRNRQLDAKNFFDRPDCTTTSAPGSCGDIPRFDRNQFGGSVGGPIDRDGTFLFVAYEALHLRQATTRQAAVPSQVQRESAFNAVAPNQRNPAGEAILNLYPAANVGSDLIASNTFVASPSIRSTLNQLLFKVDHHAGNNDTIAGHYALSDQDRFSPYDLTQAYTNLPGYGTFSQNRGHNVRFTWTHTFRNRLINEARFGFNRSRSADLQESTGISRSQELGFPDISGNPIDWGFPNVSLARFDNIGEATARPQTATSNTFHYVDNLAWTPGWQGGRHQLKLGAEIRRTRAPGFANIFTRGQWSFFGSISGDPLVDLLRGTPELAITGTGDSAVEVFATSLNFYLQDDIRVSSRLILNLGLRYDFNSPPVDARDHLSVPDFSPNSMTCEPKPDCQFIQAGTNGVSRSTFSRDANNFAPRVGLAWQPFATNRLVVRTAYGIFYDINIMGPDALGALNPPFFRFTVFPNTGANNIQNIVEQPGFALPSVSFMFDPNFRDGYLQHWNINLQHELRRDLLVDAAYVGTKGTKLIGTRDINQPRPGNGPRPFPQFGTIGSFGSRNSSNYHSLQLRVEKRFHHGFTFLAAYTWSKSIDDTSTWLSEAAAEPGIPQDSFDLRAQRALSNFHANHRFVLSYLHELPFGTGKRWLEDGRVLRHLFGNWQLGIITTLQSGRPFTVNRAIDQSLTGTELAASDRPDQIADPSQAGPVPNHPDPACHATVSQGGRAADVVADPASWFNPCAFAAPATPRFGNAGRNSVIGPSLKNIDVSLIKQIPLRRENHHLQLRFEFFNLPNHPNFDIPDRIFDSATFSAARSSNAFGNKPPRQIQLGLRYAF